MKPKLTYVIRRAENKQYYVLKRARNNEFTWQTETFKAKANAKKAIKSDADGREHTIVDETLVK